MQPVTRERSTCSPTPAAAAHGRSCTRHQQPCDGNVFRNRVTLTFDLFTSGSMRAERLLQSICVTILVLIARAVFLLERGHTDRQTDTNEHPTHAGGYNDDMGNYFTANGSINNVIENSRLSLPCAIQRCTNKTGSTQLIAPPSEKERARTTDDKYRKFCEVQTCDFWYIVADRHTNRQTDTLMTILHSPPGCAKIMQNIKQIVF